MRRIVSGSSDATNSALASAAVYLCTRIPGTEDALVQTSYAVEGLGRLFLPALTLHLFLVFPSPLWPASQRRSPAPKKSENANCATGRTIPASKISVQLWTFNRFISSGAVGNGYRKNGVTDGLSTTTMTTGWTSAGSGF